MDIPEARILPDAQRPLRLTEFETLFAEAVASVRRLVPGRLRLDIEVPAAHVGVVDSLQRMAAGS